MKIDVVDCGNYQAVYANDILIIEGNNINIHSLLVKLSDEVIEISSLYDANKEQFICNYRRFPKHLEDIILTNGVTIGDYWEE